MKIIHRAVGRSFSLLLVTASVAPSASAVTPLREDQAVEVTAWVRPPLPCIQVTTSTLSRGVVRVGLENGCEESIRPKGSWPDEQGDWATAPEAVSPGARVEVWFSLSSARKEYEWTLQFGHQEEHHALTVTATVTDLVRFPFPKLDDTPEGGCQGTPKGALGTHWLLLSMAVGVWCWRRRRFLTTMLRS